ncbi:MAG: hypothetical protein ACRDVG_05880 [Jatrophihabitantaceae bacterium]
MTAAMFGPIRLFTSMSVDGAGPDDHAGQELGRNGTDVPPGSATFSTDVVTRATDDSTVSPTPTTIRGPARGGIGE